MKDAANTSGPIKQSAAWSMVSPDAPARGGLWYLVWIIIVALLSAGAWALHFFLGDWQFWTVPGLGLIIFITLIIVGGKPGPQIGYSLGPDGVAIGNSRFSWDNFRAFTISGNGNSWRVELVPQKRFGTVEILPIPADQGEAIVDLLGSRLPMENADANLADRLTRYLKISA